MKQKTKFKETKTGKIPEDWTEVVLDEIAEPVSQTFDFSGKDRVIFINTGDILSGKFLHRNYSKTNILPGQAKKRISRNNILFSEIRPINKRYAFIDFNNTENYVVSTKLMVIKAKENIFPVYLYIVLTSKHTLLEFQHIAESRSGTFPQITFDSIKNYRVLIPSFAEQSAIIKILSSLDSKIELNQQMNKTLEAIGQALFKRWFVDFEFIRSSDWRVDELGKHIEFIKGKKPDKISEVYYAGYRPQILIENLNGKDSLYTNSDGMTVVGIDEPIMVMDGASSGRVEIGHDGILGSTLAKVIATSDWISNLFLYYFLKRKESEINQNTTGTSIPHADKNRIKKFQCVLPSRSIHKSFNKIALIILNKIIVNKKEIKTLSQIRDSLLPRLMSGRIRVGKCG